MSKVIILGAGKPYSGVSPSSLIFTSGNKRVLDWQIEALTDALNIGIPDITFVGGYKIDDIIKEYPQMEFVLNAKWAESKNVASLFTVELDSKKQYYISYSDIIFSKNILQKMESNNSDVVIGVDKNWLKRYASRSKIEVDNAEKVFINQDQIVAVGKTFTELDSVAEFAGLLKLSSRAILFLKNLKEFSWELPVDFLDLINKMLKSNLIVDYVDNNGEWAEMNEPQDLAKFILGSKGETLEKLENMVCHSRIGTQVRFSSQEWGQNAKKIIDDIARKFSVAKLAIRSCATDEDGFQNSCAGQYKSILNVDSSCEEAIVVAVKDVFDSYGFYNDNNQIFVQKMLDNIKISGVVLTRTLTNNSPYYVINYDDVSSRTDTVTSGSYDTLKTLLITKWLATEHAGKFNKLLCAIKELEELIFYDSLDIEFIIDNEDTVHILQVRPIVAGAKNKVLDDKVIRTALDKCSHVFVKKATPPPSIWGENSIYGVMPDWNPAEIIGIKPRKLSSTMYRHLIMDDVWARQRAEFGYRDIRPCNLLVSFAGQMYVDVRACFNSYIPANISESLGQRLVNFYLDKLLKNRDFHDKVEFNIIYTCYTFDFDERSKELLENGFSKLEIEELKKELLRITNMNFTRIDGDNANIEILMKKHQKIINSDIDSLDKVYALLEDCKKFGTIAFAHLARLAFVSMSLINSLVKIGIISAIEREKFLESIETVSKLMNKDAYMVKNNTDDKQNFIDKYGHLRPGTYDIMSKSYHEDVVMYLDAVIDSAHEHNSNEIQYKLFNKEDKINKILEEHGLKTNATDLEKFFRLAIEGRESTKFVFTKTLSKSIDLLAEFALQSNINREQVANIAIKDLLELRFGTNGIAVHDILTELSKTGDYEYQITQAIELPELISDKNDFYLFERRIGSPNYVTSKQIIAPSFLCMTGEINRLDIMGKVVLIPSADPGYDWLLGCKIAGLITMYGGANSHMTIRCAEMGLPAAIGVGNVLFENLTNAKTIELDCAKQKIRVVL